MSKENQTGTSTHLKPVFPIPIQLNEDGLGEPYNFSHISNVLVGDYHLIQGEGGKPYIVWTIKIALDDSNYSSIIIYKRYSDLECFREEIGRIAGFDNLPKLPPKDSFSLDRLLMTNRWLEERLKGIQWFLSNVLLNPRYQRLEVVRDFILS